ncbi:hypothetical protein AB8810_06970 [Xanthomonas sp. NCPPB 3005]|uniref:hypothetical protein n=1 Tax=Xanthomonas sp. NCPPB 3005 TaxID=3240913 RepID=UPI00355A84EB
MALALLLGGCNNVAPSLVPAPTPEFDIRDFVVAEERTDATEYSKAYNTFKGTGTLIARNVAPERDLFVLLEARDLTIGADAEPALVPVMFRGGVGKVEVSKSKHGEMSARPNYEWRVRGWVELKKATISVAGGQAK